MLGISENCVLPARLKEAEKLRDALQRELTALFHKSPWWEGLGGWGGGMSPTGTLQNFPFVFVCLLIFLLTMQAVGTRGQRPRTQAASAGHSLAVPHP